MSTRRLTFAGIAALCIGLLPALASAQGEANPKFEYGKHEELKKVEWKALVRAGLVYSTGNSQFTNVTAGFAASRKDTWNKFALDGGFAYARSSIFIVDDANGDLLIQDNEFYRSRSTSANKWDLKGRYDRFFTKNNSGYLAAYVGGDAVAGKEVVTGGQLGYSRQIIKRPRGELLGEVGYDASYENYSNPAQGTPGSVFIHSARLFLGGSYKLLENTSFNSSLEILSNLSQEKVPNWQTGSDHVPGLEDTRINFKAGVSTKLWKNVSLGLTFGLKYDNNPALRPAPKGFAFDEAAFPIRFPTGPTTGDGNHARFADRLDTITEAVLIVNFI
jgi:hypothetical protein